MDDIGINDGKKKKLSKAERKTLRKQHRAKCLVGKHSIENRFQSSLVPTRHLFIGNGGLDCGITRRILSSIFSQYGRLINIIMLPNKPFAVLSYQTKEEAELAYSKIHAVSIDDCKTDCKVDNEYLLKSGIRAFYLHYLEDYFFKLANTPQLYPNGLVVVEDFITEQEEAELLDAIQWSNDDERASEYYDVAMPGLDEDISKKSREIAPQQQLKHRRVKHFGYEFRYDINNVDKDKPLAVKVPDKCLQIAQRMLLKGYIDHSPDQLTVNEYLPGQGIPPHVDTHSAFENEIVSVSLLAKIVMDFRHPNGSRLAVALPRRSLLIMKDECRYLWTHGITPRKYDVISNKTDDIQDIHDGLTLVERHKRVSLTFRKIRHSPCNCNYPKMCDSQHSQPSKHESNVVPSSEYEAENLEHRYVYDVYDSIADHFSGTRHSPWPRIAEFLKHLPEGSMVLDIGCGNGKYMNVNESLYMVGCDRSQSLISICRQRGLEAITCDILNLPFQSHSFDACICIAVIHHLSTAKRRIEALRECIRILKCGGAALIYVWAFEQDYSSHAQPNNEELQKTSTLATEGNKGANKGRFRHFDKQDVLVPWHRNNRHNHKLRPDTTINVDTNETIYHRYYHIFKEGELVSLCNDLTNTSVENHYYDKGNWCVVLRKKSY